MEEVANHGNYLSTSFVIGREKKQVFHYVIEKVSKRIQDWKTKISFGVGQDILSNIVAQVIPNYLMYLFLLPIDTRKDIETDKLFSF